MLGSQSFNRPAVHTAVIFACPGQAGNTSILWFTAAVEIHAAVVTLLRFPQVLSAESDAT